MKFKASIDINQSRPIVTKLFADPHYLKDYQEGFEKKELISGDAGQDGAVSKMHYKHGKREMVLTETVKANNLPDTFEAFYHHKHMDNTFLATFIELDDLKTRYTMEVDYIRMTFLPRLIGILFPSMYRKQGEKWMNNFKNLAENYKE
ncbi:MAG: SRPBCC family protein [Flavobacteriaceae bacterium]|nr:SRPBCC family protein [Flavobacteriaceae bacterium]